MSDGGEHQGDGRVVGGRYRLIERVGSGGMGTVWRAYDELVEREVAVKQPRLPGDPEGEGHRRAAHRLHREARAAARVDHPSAVSIHDVVEEDGIPWIVMELIRGESLHEVLGRGPLPPAESARIGLAVLGALRAAHAVGIVHRDVKPANVLLGQHGRVVLTDFGIAHVQGEESLTMSGEFVGSLEFIAPERMSGRGAGPASDLWSLGVLLYAAVEGWSPFRRTTLESTLAAILAADPPEPQHAGPLGPLIVRLLAKDPERRPEPEEVAVGLEAVAKGWPGVPGGDVGEAQEAADLEGFADDAGTVRLGVMGTPDEPRTDRAPESGPEADTEPEPEPAPAPKTTPTPHPKPHPKPRPTLRRPAPAALLGALLIGGVWLGISSFTEVDGKGARDQTATLTEAPAVSETTPTPTPSLTQDPWTPHREKDMDAVLSLPSRYKEYVREGGPDDQPRIVAYEAGPVDVRLTQWDKAPRSAMDQAREAHATWALYDPDARTQYTRTSFHDSDAVIADTTYESNGTRTRVMELMILTADGRMYELRVDMPKGTADEKKGTAVFKGARDRLEIGGN
ncbi:serine/threonine-protein kinase [Streptomyces sp. HC307]|uniref:serine/threonine-protein kinase n=1 Tax=Streptomyces flavusporus TaxID=3385496 RepID=UPI00391737A8